MIHSHALLYSSQEDITIGKLKQSDYDSSLDTAIVAHWMQNRDIKAIVEWEIGYNPKLTMIPSKPYILYYIWDISLLNKSILGVVGPRKHTDFAKSMVSKIIDQAKYYNLATVSWLAMGVDQLVHQYSLDNNIPTIAVLGAWFRHYLNSKDRDLIKRIVDKWWLVISEFKLSQEPQTYTYPQRNRIIAGLSDVLVLPEASKKSGSLITVEFSQKLQKPIYGTPNSSSSPINQWLHEYLQNWTIRPLLDIPNMFKNHFSNKEESTKKISLLPSFDLDTQKLLDSFQNQSSITISNLLQNWFSQEKVYSWLARLEMEKVIHQPIPGTYVLS